MGEQIWNSMDQSLKGPMAFMLWVQECAGILASANLPMIWTNPMGMKCVQSPFTTKDKRIQTKSMHSKKPVVYQLRTPTTKINKNKMMSSSSPNMIHSCDASHLLRTVSLCNARGIDQFAFVHDSFGSHPDDAEKLLQCAKQAWIEQYSENWMEIWYNEWCTHLGSNDIPHWSEYVEMGNLNIGDVLNSDFFFA